MTAPSPQTPPDDHSFLLVARVLLLIQGSIGIASFLEALLAGAAQGVALVPVLGLTGGSAFFTLWLAGRLNRRGRRARKAIIVLQSLWLMAAAVDLGLALLVTQRLLEPVPLLTRVVLPIALIRMLRSPRARAVFAMPPSRRARRQSRKLAGATA